MITRVKLVNWRSHEDTELEFSKGTNVLVGSMGSGKSSVMDAICFALFGTFPALSAKKLSIDDCVMNTPEQKQVAAVEVTVAHGGREYTILREVELGKGTKRSEVRLDGSLLEGPQTKRVTEVIEQKLGVDYELFSRAVYSEQNQLDYFLQLRAGDRKKKIDELLRIERFENARKSLGSLSRALKMRREDIEKALAEKTPEAIGAEVAKSESELRGLEGKISAARQELAEATRRKEEADTMLRSLEAKEREARALREKKAVLESQVDASARRAGEIKERLGAALGADLSKQKADALERKSAVEKELDVLEAKAKELAELNAELKAKQERVRGLAEKAAEARKLGQRLQKLEERKPQEKLDEAREAVAKAERELGQAKAEIGQYTKRAKELENAGDKCPVCDSDITHNKKVALAVDAKERMAKAERRAESANAIIGNTNVKSLESEARELMELRASLKSSGAEGLEQARADVTGLEARLRGMGVNDGKRKELQSERDTLLEKVQKVDRISEMQVEYKHLKAEEASRKQELERVDNDVRAMAFDEKALVEARDKARTLSSNESGLKAVLESGDERLKDKKSALEANRKMLAELRQRESDTIAIKQAGDSLGVMGSALESTQAQLREEFTVAINAGLEDVWPRIYPYGDYESCRLAAGDGGYVLQLLRNRGEWVDVEGVASGGERSTAALALRIAFSLVLTQNLSWLVLDEPTHNLDTKGVELLATALREHLPGLVEQVFIITHDEGMEQAVSGTLYRLDRDKEVGAPTRAVLVSSEGE